MGKNRNTIFWAAGLGLFFILLIIPDLFSDRDFFVEDEARHAEVLREMVEENHWILPHLNGRPYPDKPPLYFWLASGVSLLTGGITPWTLRIVTWMGILGMIWAIFLLGKCLFDPLAGFFAGLFTLISPLGLTSLRIFRMDPLFSAWILWALYFFFLGYRKKKKIYSWLFFLFAALAVLTKGPLGLIFTLFPAVLFLFIRGKAKDALRLCFHPGAALFLGMVLGWLMLAAGQGGKDYLDILWNQQILSRTLQSYQHGEPFYFYLIYLPFAALPWIVLLPKVVRTSLRFRNQDSRQFLWSWFGLCFFVISILSCKLIIYLLPLLPALAILAAGSLSEYLRERNFKMFENWKGCAAGASAALLYFGLPLLLYSLARNSLQEINTGFQTYLYIYSGIVAAAVLFALIKKSGLYSAVFLTGVLYLSVLSSLIVFPRLNNLFSPRLLGEKVQEYAAGSYRVATYRVTRGILNFYAGQVIEELKRPQVRAFLRSGKKNILILKKHNYQSLARKTRALMDVRQRFRLNNETYLLVSGKGE